MIFLSSSRVYPASKINDLPNREFETRFDWWEDLSSTDQINGFDPEYGIAANFSVDGATKTIYGASKAAADCFCQEYADAFGLPVIINRCGVVAGAGQFGLVTQGWFTFWAISCLFERPLRYFGHKGKQVRDILFIDDLFDLIRIQLNRIDSLGGKVWNVGGGRANSISLMEAGALMEEIFGRPVKASVEEEVRRGDMLVYITDNRRAYEDLNWAPRISLEQGAQRIARWVTDNRSMLANSGL
jgi:CDP-paratose 2-epimerase